jgi:hypothetical protein
MIVGLAKLGNLDDQAMLLPHEPRFGRFGTTSKAYHKDHVARSVKVDFQQQ